MSNYYTVLIGADGMKNLDCIERFNSHEEAERFAAARNEEFKKDYADEDAWRNDGNSLHWITLTDEETARDHNELKNECDEFIQSSLASYASRQD